MFSQRFRRFPNFALTGKKDEGVAGAGSEQFVNRLDDGVHQIAIVPCARRGGCFAGLTFQDRSVTDFDGVKPSGHFDDGKLARLRCRNGVRNARRRWWQR